MIYLFDAPTDWGIVSATTTYARLEDVSMTDVAQQFDVTAVFEALLTPPSRDVSTNAFLRYVSENFGFTVEYARNLIYSLIELGRIVLTDRYTLRPAE